MSTQENLEERIERIRKRNEELQKRHAEAEADKQRAKRENAMVQTKMTNYEDWPKEHKYDKVDFTFDDDLDEINVVNSDICGIKSERHKKSQFAEGDGPPPDPSYSFLKDTDRDLNRFEQAKTYRNANDKSQWNQRDNATQQRGHGTHNRGNFRGNSRGKPTRGGDFSRHNRNESHPDYDAWRSERNKIDEARINRQRNAEGKWRREWDTEKINNEGVKETHHSHKPERVTVGDVLLSGNRKTASLDSGFDKPKDISRNRPNITVSLNKTGEVQSVKVTSPPAIGSGRVGPRQTKSRTPFPPLGDFQKDEFTEKRKSRDKYIDGTQTKKNDASRSPKKYETTGGSVQNRLNKYKQANGFSHLSKELKDVSAEIEGLCNSVENLNKKHWEISDDIKVSEKLDKTDDIMPVKQILDDFVLSADLILDANERKESEFRGLEYTEDVKCNFVDMEGNDIENYIEREVQKNNTCLSPEPEKSSEFELSVEIESDLEMKGNDGDFILEDETENKFFDLKSDIKNLVYGIKENLNDLQEKSIEICEKFDVENVLENEKVEEIIHENIVNEEEIIQEKQSKDLPDENEIQNEMIAFISDEQDKDIKDIEENIQSEDVSKIDSVDNIIENKIVAVDEITLEKDLESGENFQKDIDNIGIAIEGNIVAKVFESDIDVHHGGSENIDK